MGVVACRVIATDTTEVVAVTGAHETIKFSIVTAALELMKLTESTSVTSRVHCSFGGTWCKDPTEPSNNC